ncbi:Signal recognition particle receptor beta subunit [Balamuthia mandrillaris]
MGTLDLDSYKVKVQMWEPYLNPRFYGDNHNRYIYRGTCGVLLCYDVTDRVSFENVRNWNVEVERYALDGVPKIMVATKVDVPPDFHALTSEEARELADECGMDFAETSAKENTNARETLEQFCRELVADALAYDPQEPANTGLRLIEKCGFILDLFPSKKAITFLRLPWRGQK